jgi:hypothetical protein
MIINKEITLQELWLSHAGFRVRYHLYTYPSACYIRKPYKIIKSMYESPIMYMLKQVDRMRKLTLTFTSNETAFSNVVFASKHFLQLTNVL